MDEMQNNKMKMMHYDDIHCVAWSPAKVFKWWGIQLLYNSPKIKK